MPSDPIFAPRYIQLEADVTVPSGSAAVNRLVEVRACHPADGRYKLDWRDAKVSEACRVRGR